MKREAFLIMGMIITASLCCAQKRDTVYIHQNNIETHSLKEGKSVYLVYFKMTKDAPRTMTQFWTRKVKKETVAGKDILEITQSWEGKDSLLHTSKSICDAKTFRPLFHENWWNLLNGTKSASVFDYVTRKAVIDGKDISQDTTAKGRQRHSSFLKATDVYNLNWHLDLEIFTVLPLALHKTFVIPFYNPGFSEPKNIFYTVINEGKLTGYDQNEVDCWILQHESKDNTEQYWISKKTKEVLKLEQEVNGKIYRYKIRLGFWDNN